jgi:hypothetical protein
MTATFTYEAVDLDEDKERVTSSLFESETARVALDAAIYWAEEYGCLEIWQLADDEPRTRVCLVWTAKDGQRAPTPY